MIELLVRHLLVLAVAGLLALILRNRSAALRHALWAVALTACILLPVLQRVALTLPAQFPFMATIEWAASTDDPLQAMTGQKDSAAPPAATAFDWTRLAWGIYIAVALALILRWFVGLQQASRHARRGRAVDVVGAFPLLL